MVRKRKAYRRAQRKLQVIEQLLIWHENGYATEATAYKLAGALDLTPSPHFAAILNEMVAEGDLERVCREQSGRWSTFFYYLSYQHLSRRNVSRRRISVRSRGVAVGQLEMFS